VFWITSTFLERIINAIQGSAVFVNDVRECVEWEDPKESGQRNSLTAAAVCVTSISQEWNVVLHHSIYKADRNGF
jgi:hypothetical protein